VNADVSLYVVVVVVVLHTDATTQGDFLSICMQVCTFVRWWWWWWW